MNPNHFFICPWHPGMKFSPTEWERCVKNCIAALHHKNCHSFPCTLPSGIPLAPPAWTLIPQSLFSNSMHQLAPIHHNSAGYCSIPSPSGTAMQFLSTHFYPENVTASYQNTTGVVKCVQGSETRKPLSNISSTFFQQGLLMMTSSLPLKMTYQPTGQV